VGTSESCELDPGGVLQFQNSPRRTFVVPVVFLVLPVTVLFAIFPGLAVLQVGL
jgi:tight adherence protein C